MSWKKEVEQLTRKRKLAHKQGGDTGVSLQHAKGLLTIRERITTLLDSGSFEELGSIAGQSSYDKQGNLSEFTPSNYVLGFGTIGSRPCIVGGEDFTLKGGSPNAAGLRKSVYAEELACAYRLPLIRLHQGAGGSVAGASQTTTVGSAVNAKSCTFSA